jgi:hypothetical protein
MTLVTAHGRVDVLVLDAVRLEYLLLQIILRRISTREEVMPDFNREALKRGCAADPAANDDLENAGTVATDALRLLNASVLRSKDVDCTQSASAMTWEW